MLAIVSLPRYALTSMVLGCRYKHHCPYTTDFIQSIICCFENESIWWVTKTLSNRSSRLERRHNGQKDNAMINGYIVMCELNSVWYASLNKRRLHKYRIHVIVTYYMYLYRHSTEDPGSDSDGWSRVSSCSVWSNSLRKYWYSSLTFSKILCLTIVPWNKPSNTLNWIKSNIKLV